MSNSSRDHAKNFYKKSNPGDMDERKPAFRVFSLPSDVVVTSLSITPAHRYLVRFHPKRISHVFTDVLIVGSGIAGLRAALEIPPALNVIVVSKDVLAQSNSAYAQGGIAGAMDPVDDTSSHAADTMAAGKGLCDEKIVEMVVREAPERIQ